MTLRRRLVLSGLLIGLTLVLAAAWQIHLYMNARAALPDQIADSMSLDEAASHLMTSLLVSLSVDFVLLALAWVGLRRTVLYPLEEMREQLNVVTSGSLHTEISIAGPAELQQVAHDAESMRRALVRQIDQTTAAYQTLDAEAPVSLSIRNALSASAQHDGVISVFGQIDSAQSVITGDWWDTVPTPDGTALVVVDVAGHGADAGVVGLQIKAVLSAGLAAGFSVPNVFQRVSHDLRSVDSLAASAAVVMFPHDTQAPIQVTNAGHPDVLIAYEDGFIEHVGATGPLLVGLGGDWTTKELACPSSAIVVVVSDGLIETEDANGHQFGITGVSDVVRAVNHQHDVANIASDILSAARATSVTWNRDDVTVVVGRRLGK